jgi:hypothetical protein
VAVGATLVTVRARFSDVAVGAAGVADGDGGAEGGVAVGALRVSSKLWVAVVPVCTTPSFQVTL